MRAKSPFETMIFFIAFSPELPFGPTGSGGVGKLSGLEGRATYLAPVRVPELAWRLGDPDEAITQDDMEKFDATGWKSSRGVRTQQAVRSVHHVLTTMLASGLTSFKPPKGLELMNSGDVRVWSLETGMWYRGPGSASAEPPPNTQPGPTVSAPVPGTETLNDSPFGEAYVPVGSRGWWRSGRRSRSGDGI